MKLPLYQVDAFTDRLFAGNPAAVVPLERPLPDALMQAIAAENNLAETAFITPADAAPTPVRAGLSPARLPNLRWFTPTVEVDLCGHATIATAHVFWRHRGATQDILSFQTKSGPIAVTRRPDQRLELDFPADPLRPAPPDIARQAAAALGQSPLEALIGRDCVAVLPSAAAVRALRPNFEAAAAIPARGLLATAPGDEPGVDFVCRFFAPQSGVPEDPVTGSAYCALAPYWAARLGRHNLHAQQLSPRGGDTLCQNVPEAARVRIAGFAVTYLVGEIEIPA